MNSTYKIEKNIVSESNLLKLFMDDVQFDIHSIPCFETYFLSDFELEQLLLSWKKNIDRDSTLLSRQSLSTLTDLPQNALYYNLDQEDWLKAAQVSEIFRNPLICKNAGRLDFKALQKNIRQWFIHSEQQLSLSIAWGQPKRSAGGIKCIGPHADLAELFSIVRLITIVGAIEKILKLPIKLTILTGGHRFYPALFTRATMTLNYDLQRQKLADYMDDQQRIYFKSFIEPGEPLNYAIDDHQLKQISDDQILSQFRAVLLNIDWEHLLHPQISQRYNNPHNIELSTHLVDWLNTQSLQRVNQFIRQVIYALLTPHQNTALATQAEDIQTKIVWENMLNFMHQVAWESTRKYIAIHEIKAEKQKEHLSDFHFRLTVHEKDDIRSLPALLTLGVKGGNQLSQHVMAFLINRELQFGAFAEFWDQKLVLIKLKTDCHFSLFEWLKGSEQPLCVSDIDSNALLAALSMSSRLIN